MSFHHPPGAIAVLQSEEPRAVPYSAVAFEAFKVDGSCPTRLGGKTYRLGRLSAADLRGALNEALLFPLYHKDHLIIRESGDAGVKLRIFAIRKKSTPRYVHKDHVTRRQHDLYADPVCVIDGAAL